MLKNSTKNREKLSIVTFICSTKNANIVYTLTSYISKKKKKENSTLNNILQQVSTSFNNALSSFKCLHKQ